MTPRTQRVCTTLPRPRRRTDRSRVDLELRYTLTLAGHIAALQVKP